MKMFVRFEVDDRLIYINPACVTTVQELYNGKIRICFHETDFVDVVGSIDSVLSKIERGLN